MPGAALRHVGQPGGARDVRRRPGALGSLHVLVNNAALTPNRPGDTERRNRLYAYNSTPLPRDTLNFTAEMTDEEWHR